MKKRSIIFVQSSPVPDNKKSGKFQRLRRAKIMISGTDKLKNSN
jgi:hypothetical protein